MSCEANVCGTGTWTGPKPGDPEGTVTLHANQVYGGINLSWSFPLVNPYAVAHTLVYRGVNNDLSAALLLAHAGGSIYLDRLDPVVDTTYFYWIKIVSINGTTGDPVGPVSAIARPQVQQTLESLTGLIDASKLAQDLKTNISGLTSTDSDLYAKFLDLQMGNTTFRQALLDVQNGVNQAMTFVAAETTQRQDGDNATAQQLQLLAAANQHAIAAVADNTQVAVGLNTALASRVTTAESTLNGNVTTGQVGLVTKVDTVNGIVSNLTAEYFAKVEVNGLIGGFGLYNNGQQVDAGFDVDRFWVGRTNTNKVKPFIIDNGIVYMDMARIRDADIGTLKIAGDAITTMHVAYATVLTVPPSGSITAVNTSLTMPSGSSGAVITMASTLYCPNNASVTIIISKNGTAIGATGVSLLGGFYSSAAFSCIDIAPAGTNTYTLGFLNPSEGIPGGNQQISVQTCSIIVSGAKR